MDAKGIARFSKYAVVGISTLLLDLGLLFVLTDGIGLYPVFSAGVAFIIAVTVNYLLCRRYVFRGSTRGMGEGYVGFLIIAGTGLALVTGGMHLLVTRLGWHYMACRLVIAAVTGLWEYLLNLYVNFRVAGKHV